MEFNLGKEGDLTKSVLSGDMDKRIAALRGPQEGLPVQAGPPHPLPSWASCLDDLTLDGLCIWGAGW